MENTESTLEEMKVEKQESPLEAPKPNGGKKNKVDNRTAAPSTESLYTAEELAKSARTRFRCAPEVVRAALKTANKDRASLSQATQIVKNFLERKVK